MTISAKSDREALVVSSTQDMVLLQELGWRPFFEKPLGIDCVGMHFPIANAT
jgi:hypothetical protein